jgi:hypothetical protein
MVHVQKVAAFVLSKLGSLTAMKLQKLCYYAYGYQLAWEDQQLFPERFQAWANGPVCPELYQLHRGRLQLSVGDMPGNPGAQGVGRLAFLAFALGSCRILLPSG